MRKESLTSYRQKRDFSKTAGHGGGKPTRESAVVMGVAISKPEKALWPNAGDDRPVTKLDLARYFEQIGQWMLPHLNGRATRGTSITAPPGLYRPRSAKSR